MYNIKVSEDAVTINDVVITDKKLSSLKRLQKEPFYRAYINKANNFLIELSMCEDDSERKLSIMDIIEKLHLIEAELDEISK